MATTGRKRIYEDPMGVYNIRLTGAHAIKARRIGKGNVSEGARVCIEFAPASGAPVDRTIEVRGVDRRKQSPPKQ